MGSGKLSLVSSLDGPVFVVECVSSCSCYCTSQKRKRKRNSERTKEREREREALSPVFTDTWREMVIAYDQSLESGPCLLQFQQTIWFSSSSPTSTFCTCIYTYIVAVDFVAFCVLIQTLLLLPLLPHTGFE